MKQRTLRAPGATRPYTYIGRLMPLFALAAVGLACRPVEKGVKAPPPPPKPAPVKVVEAPKPAPKPEVKKPEEIGVKIVSNAALQTPESITFVAELDTYLVSNVNGSATDKDDNGFILKVSADGEKLEKFIDGASDKVTLNAPKGMGISGGVLYVTDIDHVRLFDLASGEAKGSIEVKGATFLNDITVSATGDVYVSDSGLKPDFSSSGTDAIYKIKDGKAKKVLASKKLGGPNGLLAGEDGVWVVTFGTGELSFVTDKGKQTKVQKLPKGKNDGIVKTNDGRVLISSWEGSSVLVGEPGGDFVELITGVESPADIGYDAKRDRLLIPQFLKNTLVLQKLDPKTTPHPAKKESEPAPAQAKKDAEPGDKHAKKEAEPAAPQAEKPSAPPVASIAKGEPSPSAPPAGKGEKAPDQKTGASKGEKSPAAPAASPAPSKDEKTAGKGAPVPPVAETPAGKGPASPASPATPATPATPSSPANKGEKGPATPATPAVPAAPPKEAGKPTPPSAPTPPTPPGAAKKP